MAGSNDRRKEIRMEVSKTTTCSFGGTVMDDLGPVKVRDLSMAGVGLLLGREVEVGNWLAIGLSNTPKGINKTVLVHVTHVTPVPGGFLVGGNFETPLSYQELTSFIM